MALAAHDVRENSEVEGFVGRQGVHDLIDVALNARDDLYGLVDLAGKRRSIDASRSNAVMASWPSFPSAYPEWHSGNMSRTISKEQSLAPSMH